MQVLSTFTKYVVSYLMVCAFDGLLLSSFIWLAVLANILIIFHDFLEHSRVSIPTTVDT